MLFAVDGDIYQQSKLSFTSFESCINFPTIDAPCIGGGMCIINKIFGFIRINFFFLKIFLNYLLHVYVSAYIFLYYPNNSHIW